MRHLLLLASLLSACAAPVQGSAHIAAPTADAAADAAPRKPAADAVAAPDVAAPAADVPAATDVPATPSVLQTTPCRVATSAPKWWHDAVGYEIFVRSFADSDGDGIGDLKGVLAHLDYLNDGKPGQGNDLEVDVLWLMPTFPSPSYHGYDVTNYRGVNPDYGTDADLDALVAAAHARGMKVVLDLVVNHTSSQHPWFVDSAAQTGHQDWYVWADKDLGWKQPFGKSKVWYQSGVRFYYAVFSKGMPDLNFTTAAVRQEVQDIGAYWLGRGLDGFRLDAVRYLVEDGPGAGQQEAPETIAYWQQFSTAMAAQGNQPLLVGEAWAANAVAAKYHGGGTGLPMTFDFDAAAATLMVVQTGDASALQQVVCAEDGIFPKGFARGTFLTNHDMVRVATQLATADGGTAGLRLAAALLLTLPGTPWIYYGEELGMANGPGTGDQDKRLPMPWDGSDGGGFTTGQPWQPLNAEAATVNVAAESPQPASMLSLYRQLVRLRKAHAALRTGTMELVTAPAGLWAFVRTQGADRVLVAVNLTDAPLALPVPAGKDALDGTPVVAGGLAVAPMGVRVVLL